MKAMHNIGASYFARHENFDMANECLVKIQKYQSIADTRKWFIQSRLIPNQ